MAKQSRYVVMTTAAKRSARVRYTRIAVVELTPDFDGTPCVLDARAPGVSRIVYDYGASGDVTDALVRAEDVRARFEAAARI